MDGKGRWIDNRMIEGCGAPSNMNAFAFESGSIAKKKNSATGLLTIMQSSRIRAMGS